MRAKHAKGFTLAEMLVGLAILVIVLGAGYMLLDYIMDSVNRSTTHYVAQQQAQLAVKTIIDNVEAGLYYEINPADAMQSGEYDIYCQGGNLVRLSFGDSQPTILVPGNLSVTFNKVFDTSGNQILNVVGFTVTARDNQGRAVYSITSAAKLLNMIPGRGTTGSNNSGTVLRFGRTTAAAPVPTVIPSRCFMATAAYGSPSERHVVILRYFRDTVLLKNPAGRILVDAYYRVSPPLAKRVADSRFLRGITRALLSPVVVLALMVMYWKQVLAWVIIALGGLVFFAWFRIRSYKAVKAH